MRKLSNLLVSLQLLALPAYCFASTSSASFGEVATWLVGLIVIFAVVKSLVAELVGFGFKKRIMGMIVQEHKSALMRRRHQLITTGHYGESDDAKWQAEKDYFIEKIVKPKTGDLTQNMHKKISSWLDDITEQCSEFKSNYHSAMSGLEYERYVADELQAYGWAARVTVASGDQGVDVIAEKDGKKLVVQCKHYTNNVGNDAVQQIIAGKTFEQARFAAVVSNSEFTTSAKQLASSANVFLLHHSQLGELDVLCGISRT